MSTTALAPAAVAAVVILAALTCAVAGFRKTAIAGAVLAVLLATGSATLAVIGERHYQDCEQGRDGKIYINEPPPPCDHRPF
jgi:hypothetical protein